MSFLDFEKIRLMLLSVKFKTDDPSPLTLMLNIGHMSVLQVKNLPQLTWYWCWKKNLFLVKPELFHSKNDPYLSTTLTYILTINYLFIDSKGKVCMKQERTLHIYYNWSNISTDSLAHG